MSRLEIYATVNISGSYADLVGSLSVLASGTVATITADVGGPLAAAVNAERTLAR